MKKEFNYQWIFLSTCCYFRVNPSQVTIQQHPTNEISRIKQIAQYLMYRAGASAKLAGELTGVTHHSSVFYSIAKVQRKIDKGNLQMIEDIRKLKLILNQETPF